MNEYAILIQYDKADNLYVAIVPDLPGCMAHGHTRDQAMAEIQIAMKLWIEAAQEDGETLPMPTLYVS
jgi:predicted RNase H-like HicB family nuclease